MPTDYAIVITTTDSEKEAEFPAQSLLEARLAACVQIVPVRSIYRWE
jgi:periplasmic divalent cation tolerance protein